MVWVWGEWYRRGWAKQPITGGMDESKTNQDISVKLNPARPQVYIGQRERDENIFWLFSLIHNSSQTRVCSSKRHFVVGWSRTNGPKKGELMNWPKPKLGLTAAEWNRLCSTTHWCWLATPTSGPLWWPHQQLWVFWWPQQQNYWPHQVVPVVHNTSVGDHINISTWSEPHYWPHRVIHVVDNTFAGGHLLSTTLLATPTAPMK